MASRWDYGRKLNFKLWCKFKNDFKNTKSRSIYVVVVFIDTHLFSDIGVFRDFAVLGLLCPRLYLGPRGLRRGPALGVSVKFRKHQKPMKNQNFKNSNMFENSKLQNSKVQKALKLSKIKNSKLFEQFKNSKTQKFKNSKNIYISPNLA